MTTEKIYLELRDLAKRLKVPSGIYRPVGKIIRKASGVPDNLDEKNLAEQENRIIEILLPPWEGNDDSGAAIALERALTHVDTEKLADLLFRKLRRLPSREAVHLAQFLCNWNEPDLRQTARILKAERAAFWRDFSTVERETEAYLSDEDGKTDKLTGLALGLLVSAKRRLGKIDAALKTNKMQLQREPLNNRYLTERARIFANDQDREMIRLLKLCDAQNGRAGQLGNTLYLSYLMEKGQYDEVERIARQIESRIPPSRLARAFLANAKISRDRDPSAVSTVFDTIGLDVRVETPDFDELTLSRTHSVPSAGSLVSVVMTAFNAELHLPTAIESILNQSYRKIELIIVDDCSTDKTPEIIHRAANTDSRVHYVRTSQNCGTYMAKNAGIKASQGQFIALCDSDDIWTNDHLSQHLNLMLEENQVVLSTSDWLRIFNDTKIDINPDGTIVEVCPHSTFFRKEIFDRVGYFDSVRFGADREFVSRVTLEYGGAAVQHIPEVLTIGRRHEASLTTSGAGMIALDQKSDIRLAYWGIWNAWQNKMVLGTESLFNSGAPEERPYEVPEAMRP